MTQRIQYFDQMKGIAILLVVIGHVVQFSFGYTSSNVVNMLSIFHMPIFFYISGYLAYKSAEMGWKVVCKRLLLKTKQLIIPLTVVGGTYCVFMGNDIVQWAMSGFGGYWFLYSLSILTIVFLFFEQFARKFSKWYVYVALWGLPYLCLIFLKINHIESRGGLLPVDNMVTYYRYYLIGWLCHKYMPMKQFLFENKIVYALAFVAYVLQWYLCEHHNMLLIFVGGMGAIIVLQNWLNGQNAETQSMKLLSYLGRNSLSIYVFHYFFIPDVSNVMHDFLQVSNPFIWMLTFSVALAIPIIVATCFVGSIIEKNKFLKYIVLGKRK